MVGRFSTATHTAPAETLVVRTFYNAEGLTDSISRWALPDPEAIGRITTRWRYDRAGRRVAEIAPDSRVVTWTETGEICNPDEPLDTGCRPFRRDTSEYREYRDSTRYDPAGNVLETVSRRGYSISTRYDELNRPVKP